MNHKEKRRNLWLSIAVAAVTVIVAIVDFNTPRGMAVGILYVVPVFLSLWLPQHRIIFVTGSVSALLVVIGFLYSPPSPSPLIFALVNRGLSILSIGLLMIIGTHSRAADYFSLLLQKRTTEQALREAEARYRSLVRLGGETGEAIVMMQDIDEREGVHIFCNSIWSQLTTYPEEELLKMSFFDLVHPEDREECLKVYRRKMRGQNVSKLYEMNIVNKHGSIVPVELVCGQTTYRWRPVNVAYIRDISERKYAEEMLRKSEQKYRTLVENIPQKIFHKDTNSVYVSCNANYAQDLKMKPSEIAGKTDYDFYPKELAEKYRTDDRRIIESGLQDEMDEEYIQYGQKRVVHTVKTPIKNEKGRVAGVLGIFWDITEQRQMQEKLIITDRLASVGQLAAGIIHEINNPLSSVVGFTELLTSRKDLPADAKDDLNIINGEAQRIVQIAKGLLTFARQQKPEKESVDIHSIIQGVLQLRTYEHKVNNIEVDSRFAPDLPQVMVNAGQLQQVFINLVVNAEHAILGAHRRGRLTIFTERAGDMARISFADDGPGISIENMRKLFTPFFTTKEAGKGTGLGLSICHGIVTEHGGNIHAESEPGKGATFIVELPISK